MSTDLERLKALTQKLPNPDLLMGLVDDLPDAVVVVDRKGSIVLFNRQAELLFGYSRSEVVGTLVDGLLPRSLQGIHEQHRADYLANPTVRQMGARLNLKALHKDNGEFQVEIHLSPRQTSDGLYVAAVVRKVK